MKPILITGATGFIGGAVAKRLAQSGRAVRALVRPTSDTAALKALGVELAPGDVSNAASVRRAAAGADSIIHCAALTSDWGDIETFRAVNVGGTRNAVEAALAENVRRFVHMSTNDVLGLFPGRVMDDTMETRPSGYPYTDTKYEAERLVFEAHGRRGLPATALRPCWVYGPGDRTFMPEVVHAMRTRQFVYMGSRKYLLNLTYIENLVDAVLLALEHEKAVGRAYLVVDGLITWEELAGLLSRELGLPAARFTLPLPAARAAAAIMETLARLARSGSRPVLTRYALAVISPNMRFSGAALGDELGFTPAVSTDEGLRRTIEWMKKIDISKIKVK